MSNTASNTNNTNNTSISNSSKNKEDDFMYKSLLRMDALFYGEVNKKRVDALYDSMNKNKNRMKQLFN